MYFNNYFLSAYTVIVLNIFFLHQISGQEALVSKANQISIYIALDNTSAIKRLLRENPGLANVRCSDGSTFLKESAETGKKHTVKILLASGADPNLSDSNNFTPLMAAVVYGYSDIVKLLLAAGARVKMRNRSRFTAMDYTGDLGLAPDEIRNQIRAMLLEYDGRMAR